MNFPILTPSTLKEKALKIWEKQSIHKAYILKSPWMPIEIKFSKYKAKQLLTNFAEVRSVIQSLILHCKDSIGFGYEIKYEIISTRELGEQSLPVAVIFPQLQDFLKFIQKKSEFTRFCQCADEILTKYPELMMWLAENTDVILNYQEEWQQLLTTCNFLRQNPLPNRYLRELDIPGVDSKFIEMHKNILSQLFEVLLPPRAINHNVNRQQRYFEQRYGFKIDEQLIRLRILDNINFHDVSLPLSEFRALQLDCNTVYITENKINGLVFPRIKKSIVIFGLGYGIQSLKDIAWLQQKIIFYWGDIDTHGFAMLAQLRKYYPHTQSLLMDLQTLFTFRDLCVMESKDNRCLQELPQLNKEESTLYKNLINNVWGVNLRLEQERISFQYLLQDLKSRSLLPTA